MKVKKFCNLYECNETAKNKIHYGFNKGQDLSRSVFTLYIFKIEVAGISHPTKLYSPMFSLLLHTVSSNCAKFQTL